MYQLVCNSANLDELRTLLPGDAVAFLVFLVPSRVLSTFDVNSLFVDWGSGRNGSSVCFLLGFFVMMDRLDSEVAAMESDGRCTVVACKDASLRLLSSLDHGGFVQASPTSRPCRRNTVLSCLSKFYRFSDR